MNRSDTTAPSTVLALQGGGALGAYQAGVCQGLAEHGIQLDWIVGTSIGAINGAIIAGNPPGRRVEKLRGFWESVAQEGPLGMPFPVVPNSKQEITVRHVMASGALPPGFPPVEVDGVAYWDGGVYSNTPLDIVLDDNEQRDLLCFLVNLWDPWNKLPHSIVQALTQEKNIRYSSHVCEHLEDHERIQNLRRAVRLLTDRLSQEERATPEVQRLASLGCSGRINVVRLVMKNSPEDEYFKDVDFRRAVVEKRWAAGYADAERLCRNKAWLQPLAPEVGLAIYDVPK